MGDRLLAALVIAAVAVLITLVVRGLIRWDRTLTGQAPTSSGRVDCPHSTCSVSAMSQAALDRHLQVDHCNAQGPAGMWCDRPPHDPFERCEENGIGWRCATERPPAGVCVNCPDPDCEGCWGLDTHYVDDWQPS